MRLIALAIAPLALAACSQGDTASPPAEETKSTSAEQSPTPATSTPSRTGTVGIPEFGIPVSLQGSWGMVPADCTSGRSDAKGLLRVSSTTLTFYESVGRLGTIKNRSENSIRADFAFTGEGMEWTRDVELQVGGDTLTRLDRGAAEPGGRFTYTRCQS